MSNGVGLFFKHWCTGMGSKSNPFHSAQRLLVKVISRFRRALDKWFPSTESIFIHWISSSTSLQFSSIFFYLDVQIPLIDCFSISTYFLTFLSLHPSIIQTHLPLVNYSFTTNWRFTCILKMLRERERDILLFLYFTVIL